MPTAPSRPRRAPCTASSRFHSFHLFRPSSLRRSILPVATSPRSATSLPPTTGPTRWPSALSALLCRLDGRTSDGAPSSGQAPLPEPPSPIPLPPLPSLNELPHLVTDLVLRLNRLGTRRENRVLASMYRHLAYWPTDLALSWALIAPLDANGSLSRAIADALTRGQTQAARLAPRLDAPPLDATTGAVLRSAAEPFAKMIVICALLRAATNL
jgi:hypothetical protein